MQTSKCPILNSLSFFGFYPVKLLEFQYGSYYLELLVPTTWNYLFLVLGTTCS